MQKPFSRSSLLLQKATFLNIFPNFLSDQNNVIRLPYKPKEFLNCIFMLNFPKEFHKARALLNSFLFKLQSFCPFASFKQFLSCFSSQIICCNPTVRKKSGHSPLFCAYTHTHSQVRPRLHHLFKESKFFLISHQIMMV